MKMVKNLKGTDKILNLKRVQIIDIDSFNSSSCSGPVRFEIDCETKHGYCEDPNFSGRIEILETKKEKAKRNIYTLKIKFIPDDEE